MMNAVRGEVYPQTGKRQRPYATSALLGDFYFVPPETTAAAAAATPPAATVAALPSAAATVTRAEPPPAAAAGQPSAEEQRLSALLRVENALLPTGAARREVQAALRALGHASGRGRPDGRFGPETRDALRDFQAVARLDPTGHVDRPTLEALKRQAARLQATLAPEKPAAAAPPRPTPPEPAATALPAEPPPPPPPAATVVEAAPEPTSTRALPATTMGVCRLRSSSWTGERQLMCAQCRKLGGAFTPFDD